MLQPSVITVQIATSTATHQHTETAAHPDNSTPKQQHTKTIPCWASLFPSRPTHLLCLTSHVSVRTATCLRTGRSWTDSKMHKTACRVAVWPCGRVLFAREISW